MLPASSGIEMHALDESNSADESSLLGPQSPAQQDLADGVDNDDREESNPRCGLCIVLPGAAIVVALLLFLLTTFGIDDSPRPDKSGKGSSGNTPTPAAFPARTPSTHPLGASCGLESNGYGASLVQHS